MLYSPPNLMEVHFSRLLQDLPISVAVLHSFQLVPDQANAQEVIT